VSHQAEDELPMVYKSGEKGGGENYKIRTSLQGIKAELPRIQSETIKCHNGHIRGMVPRLRRRVERIGRK